MRAIEVSPATYNNSNKLLDPTYRLRACVFRERLNWDVTARNGRESDASDDRHPTYILTLSGRNKVVGSVRMLPATSPTLLGVLFPVLGNSGLLKPHATMIESSRFCVDTAHEIGRAGEVLHDATWTMFAAIIKSSMPQGYSVLVKQRACASSESCAAPAGR